MNENGQSPLELCSHDNLCIRNTFSFSYPHHKVPCKHTRAGWWHQLDLVITRKSLLNYVFTTQSYHSVDCDADHSLIASEVWLNQGVCHSKQKCQPCINTAKTVVSDLCKQFTDSMRQPLQACPTGGIDKWWNHVHDVIYNTTIDTFGKSEKQNLDWLEAGTSHIKVKCEALVNYK